MTAPAIRSPATRTSASMTRRWMTRSRCASTSHEMYNYGFDNFAGFPNNRDVGVIILDKPVILPEYGTITDAGAITSNKSVEVTVSGYGITDGHAASDPTVSFRERLMATSTVITSTDTVDRRLQPEDPEQRRQPRWHLLGRLRRPGVLPVDLEHRSSRSPRSAAPARTTARAATTPTGSTGRKSSTGSTRSRATTGTSDRLRSRP